MSSFDAVRNRKRGEEAKQRVLSRTYSPQEDTEETDMFSAVRNRSMSIEPIAAPVTVNPILQSTLSGVGAGKPEPIFMGQQKTVQPVPGQSAPTPVQEDKGGGIMGAVDGFNAFTDRAKSAATFGLTKLVDQLFTKVGTDESKQAMQEQLDRAKDAKGGMVADILGSLVSGQAAYKAGSAIVNPLIQSAPKLVQGLARGAAAGAAFEVPRQAAEEVGERLGGDQQTTAQRLKNIGISTALGGLTDLGVGAGGMASKGIVNPLLSKATGGAIGVGSLGAALGTANELQQAASGEQQSLGGRLGDIAKATGAGAALGIVGGALLSRFMKGRTPTEADPIAETSIGTKARIATRPGLNTILEQMKPLVDEHMTPPLENPNELAKWIQRNFKNGGDDISLNEIRKMNYEEMRSLSEEIKGQITVEEAARQVSKDLGYDFDTLLAVKTIPKDLIQRARKTQELQEAYGVKGPVNRSAKTEPIVSEPVQESAVQEPTLRTEPAPVIEEPPVQIEEPTISESAPIVESSIQETTPTRRGAYQRLLDETTDPTPVTETVPEPKPIESEVQAQEQDLFTDLFGEQGLGISANSSRIRGQGPVSTVDQIVSSGIKNDADGLAQTVKAQLRSVYQNNVNALSPLKQISEEVYDTAVDASRANNIANVIVNDKFVNMQGEVVGDSLKDVFGKVAKGQDKNFLDFLNLKRATTRMARNEQVFATKLEMTPEKVEARIKTLEERYPGFEAISKSYYKFWDNVRQMGVDEGLLSQSAKEALETAEPYYVPQNRQFSRSEKPGRSFLAKSAKSSFSGQKAPIQKLTPGGSGRDLVDARKSTIEAVGSWTNAILRNRTMQSIVKSMKADPDSFDGVLSFVDTTDNVKASSIKQMNEIIAKDGIEGLMNSLDDDFNMLFNKSKDINLDAENVVRAMVDGEPVYIKVGNAEVLKSLLSMGPQTSSVLIDVLSAFSNATKRGATGLLAPVFAIKGATMDLTSSAIQSKTPIKQAAYTVYSIFSGIGDALSIPGLRNWAQEYERAGGGYSYALKGEKKLNKSISNITRYPVLSPQNVGKYAKKALASPFTVLERVGNIAENAPRIAASKLERQALGNEITPENIRKVMNAGRDATVNYSIKGLNAREIEAIAPYSNAAVQGTRRILVAFKKNPVRTAAAIGALSVLPKLIEYSRFHDDEDYKMIPARDRMRHTYVNKNEDGSFTKIPLDPAYTSFGEMTIEGLRAFKDGDPKAFQGSMDALVNAWTPPMLTGILQGLTKGGGTKGSLAGLANSTVLGPPSALLTNKSFTGSPIVSQSLADRSPKYQYDEKTSAVAKKIGELIGSSPIETDYIIKAYGGDLARLILPLTSDIGQGNTRNTLLRNFIVDPAFTNTLSEDFYKAKDKMNAVYADFNEAGAALPKWYDDDLRKALNSSAKGSLSKDLAELRAYKKEITADKSLTSKDKTKKIREVQTKINDIYINVNAVLSERGVIK